MSLHFDDGNPQDGRGWSAPFRTYPWEPPDMDIPLFLEDQLIKSTEIRDEKKHPTFLLSNSSSWREMCGYNWDLTTVCKFYSPEKCKHESWVSTLPPFPGRGWNKVSAFKYPILSYNSAFFQDLCILICSSSASSIILGFFKPKAMAHTLTPCTAVP